jgi:hypothetical protein
MDNLLNELDVVKLARALPDGQARDQAIVNAIQLRLWAERAIADANAVLDDPESDDPEISPLRSSGGGSGSGGGRRSSRRK